jgi:hypothetical protein
MANPGTWYVSGGYTQLLVDGTVLHRYRITSAPAAKGHVPAALKIDGKQARMNLQPGESRDVEGKKIEVSVTGNIGGSYSAGTYDNLD